MSRRIIEFALLVSLLSLLTLIELSDAAHAALRRGKMKGPARKAPPRRGRYPYVQASMTANTRGKNRGMPLESMYWKKRAKWMSSAKKSRNDGTSPNIFWMNKPYKWARGGERGNARPFRTISDRPIKSKQPTHLMDSSPRMAPPAGGGAGVPVGPFRVPRGRKPIDSKAIIQTTAPSSNSPMPVMYEAPSFVPTANPTPRPTTEPTPIPTRSPTMSPSASPTIPVNISKKRTSSPTRLPTDKPSVPPSNYPTKSPVASPTSSPIRQPTDTPSFEPVSTLMWLEVQTGHLVSNFDGEVFGSALSLSGNGNVITVGAFLNDESADKGGRIARYDITKEGTAEVNGEEGAYLGYEVSVSSDGNRLAAFDSSIGTFYIYHYATQAEEYELLHSFDVDVFPGSADFALSGDGNWLALVGEDYDVDSGITNIWVILLEFDANVGEFTQFGEPILFGTTNASDWGYFDVAIADTGQYMAVSQLGRDEFIGEIRTYKRIPNQLKEVGTPFLSQDIEDDFGHDIEVLTTPSGKVIIGFSVLFEETVYIYTMEDDENWVSLGSPIHATDVLGAVSDVEFGFDISFSNSGSRLVVGAPAFGVVQAFEYQGGIWSAVGAMLSGPEDSQFGEVVECNADCSVIAVGAPEDCSNEDSCGGSVYMYRDSSLSI